MNDLISRQDVIDVVAKEYKYESDRITALQKIPVVELQTWVPCSEKMPDKEYELYWTTHEDGSIVLHGYTKKNGFIYNWEVDDLELRKRQGRVVAWMLIPMPEPYKGE